MGTESRGAKRLRGQVRPDLKASLEAFFSSGEKGANKHNMHIRVQHSPGRYGAPSTGLSPKAIDKALKGEPILDRTDTTIRNYIRQHNPDLLPLEPLPHVELDLARFWGSRPEKYLSAGVPIRGTFQTYATSTSVQNRSVIRRGRMDFKYNPGAKDPIISVTEEQYRPPSFGAGEKRMIWNGYCVPREGNFFIVLRTNFDEKQSTPLFYILWPLSDAPYLRQINSLGGQSLGIDPHNTRSTTPVVYLERVSSDKIVHIDFCSYEDVDEIVLNNIRSNINI